MKRAFTLIELLVVIAIIAILAAILFPVFAQAKLAAKKTVSLSNDKQLALAGIMYGGDVDDVITPAASWGPTGVNNGAFVYFGNQGYLPWTQLVNPYVKSYDLLQDPQASTLTAPPAGFNAAAGKACSPNYGINPYLLQAATFPYPAAAPGLNPRSFTAVSRPADTVFLTQKYSSSETTFPAANSWYGYYYFGAGTYFITMSTDPPDCAAPGNVFTCAAGWGDNSYYGGSGGLKALNNVEAAGAWTGGASLRGTKRMLVSFIDGHAAVKASGEMAAGTTYNGALGTNGIPTQKENQVTMTDMTKEHWYGVQ